MVRTRQRARLEAAQLQKEASSSTTDVSTSDPDVPEITRKGRLAPQSSAAAPTMTVEELAVMAASRVKERLRAECSELEHSDSDGGEVEEEKMKMQEPDTLPLEVETVSSSSKEIPGKEISSSNHGGLASSLQPEITEKLYFSFDQEEILRSSHQGNFLEDVDEEVMKKTVITPDFERKERVPAVNQSRYTLQKMRKAEREKSAGKAWFNMPAPQITPELKNDLKIIKMRSSLDPSRHYKANDSKEAPRYFQVGRVVGGPADFYSGRIPRRQQKQTMVEELLASEEFRRYNKRKYLELQRKFMGGTRRYRNIKHRKKYKK